VPTGDGLGGMHAEERPKPALISSTGLWQWQWQCSLSHPSNYDASFVNTIDYRAVKILSAGGGSSAWCLAYVDRSSTADSSTEASRQA